MGCHTVIYGLHNRADTMTLREEITEKRKEFWRDSDSAEMGEELELIIDRIDGIYDRIDEIERDLDNVRVETCTTDEKVDSLEFAVKSITMGGITKILTPPDPKPSEPFPGYNDLMEQAEEVIPILKAAIAEKKRELAHKVVPMTDSKDPEE